LQPFSPLEARFVFGAQKERINMLQFDDRFEPAPYDLACVLWATLPTEKRVRFEITSTILMDVLKFGNLVDDQKNVTQCEQARAKIEEACRTAYAKRPSKHVVLLPADFLVDA
jgi:hypothetical protein